MDNTIFRYAVTSSTIEEDFAENLQSLTGSTYDVTPELSATAADPDEIQTTFSWNSTNGYTIGFTHGHPDDSAPSPFDVITMIGNASNAKLQAAGASAVSFYENNVSSTIVTYSGNYVVTVKNWTALQSIYSTYLANPNAFILKYQQISQNYNQDYRSATLAQEGEFALLQQFGTAINLYYAPSGSTNYESVIINSANEVVINPCSN